MIKGFDDGHDYSAINPAYPVISINPVQTINLNMIKRNAEL